MAETKGTMWILQPNGTVAPSPKAIAVSAEETNQSGAKFSSKKRIGEQLAQQLSLDNFYPGLHNLPPELATVPLHTLGLTVTITNAMKVDPSFFCMLSICGKHAKLTGMLPGLNDAAMKMLDVKEHSKDWRIYGAVLLAKLHSSISKSKVRHKYMPLSQDSLGMLKLRKHINVTSADLQHEGALQDVPVAENAIENATDVFTVQHGAQHSCAELDAAHYTNFAGPSMSVVQDLSGASCKDWPPLVVSPLGLTQCPCRNITMLEGNTSCIEHIGPQGIGMVASNPISDEEQVNAAAAVEWSDNMAEENDMVALGDTAHVGAHGMHVEAVVENNGGSAWQSGTEDSADEVAACAEDETILTPVVQEDQKQVHTRRTGKAFVDENDSETCGDTGSTGKTDTLSEDGTGSTTSDIRRMLRLNGDAFLQENKFRLNMSRTYQKNFPNAADLMRFLREQGLASELNDYVRLKKAKDAASHPHGGYCSKSALALVEENSPAEAEQSYMMEKLKSSIECIPRHQWPSEKFKSISDVSKHGSWQDKQILRTLCLVLRLKEPMQAQKLECEIGARLQLSLPCIPLVSAKPPYFTTVAFETVQDRSRFEHAQTSLADIIEGKSREYQYPLYKAKANTVTWLNVSMSNLTECDIGAYLEDRYGVIRTVWAFAYHDQDAGREKAKNGFIEFADAGSAQMLLDDCREWCQSGHTPRRVISFEGVTLACRSHDPQPSAAVLGGASASSKLAALACEAFDPCDALSVQEASRTDESAKEDDANGGDLEASSSMLTPMRYPAAIPHSAPSAPEAVQDSSVTLPVCHAPTQVVCSSAVLLPQTSLRVDEKDSESTEPAESAHDPGDVHTATQQLSEPLPPKVQKNEQAAEQIISTCLPDPVMGGKNPSSLVLVEIMFQGRAKKARFESSMKIAELLSVYEPRIMRALQRDQVTDLALKVCDHDGIEYGSTLSLGCLRAEAAQAAPLNAKGGSLPLYIELDDWL